MTPWLACSDLSNRFADRDPITMLKRPWVSMAFVAALALCSVAHAQPSQSAPDACPEVLNFSFNRLQTGNPESLCQYRGKVVLIVNTASYCGYTHQYEGLEALYKKYQSRGLVVVGFPSNDFGGQEPGTNTEIAEFCRLTYGVQFPMYEKSSVTSIKTNPLYAELVTRTGQSPKWNFHKYLIDRDGKQIASFGTRVEPNDAELLSAVERLLAAKPQAPKS
jgi:glutathione peroxidase